MSDSNERTCYVGNLAPDLTDELIKELFVQVGPVEKVIVRNNDSRKYALIVFEDEESVPFAIETLDNVRLFDVSISVKPRKGSRQEIAYKKKYDRVRKEEIDKRRSCPDIPGMYQNDSSLGFNPMAQIASFANGLPPPPPPPFCTPPMSRKMDYKISNSAPRDNWHTPPDRGDYDYRNNRSGDKYSDYSSSRRNNGKLTFPSKNERSDRSRERYNDGGRDYDRRDTREYRDNRDRSQRRGYDGRRWLFMPDDRFADAVKPALEALLSDLQHTTEVLRRANLSDSYSQSREDLEPIYQEQTKRSSRNGSYANDLDDIERMVQSYSAEREKDKRRSYDEAHSPRNSVQQPPRPSVQSLLNQLDDTVSSSRRSLGPPSHAQSYNDVRGRSPSRDPSHADSMIGTLNSEYSSKHGISTIPKGDCAFCGKPIVGQVVIALAKMWHPEHYTCCECGSELGHRNFFERNGKAYCEEDYHNQFSPRCAGCNNAIKDRCVTALNKNFHLQCFCCSECGKELGEEGFHEKNGQVFCRKDFFRLFAPRCNGCQQAITANFITALGTHWHPDCFVCQTCGVGFDGGSFFDHAGLPLCEQHYHEKRGSLCVQCRHPITGRCVTAIGNKYHPEHFRCTYCNRQLTKGTFKEVDRRPFCHKCYNTTFALSPNENYRA